jgi:hypothetical protein
MMTNKNVTPREVLSDSVLALGAMIGAAAGAVAGTVLGFALGTEYPTTYGTLGAMLGSGLTAVSAWVFVRLFSGTRQTSAEKAPALVLAPVASVR